MYHSRGRCSYSFSPQRPRPLAKTEHVLWNVEVIIHQTLWTPPLEYSVTVIRADSRSAWIHKHSCGSKMGPRKNCMWLDPGYKDLGGNLRQDVLVLLRRCRLHGICQHLLQSGVGWNISRAAQQRRSILPNNLSRWGCNPKSPEVPRSPTDLKRR